MRHRVHETIAGELEKSILTDSAFVLAPINDLARRYGVSYLTMWRAVQILVKKRIITTLPGRTMRIAPGVKASAVPPLTAVDRVVGAVRKGIVDGTYQVGRHFPKIDHFALKEGVSRLTIAKAFSCLARENLAHRCRNRWIIGPAGTAAPKAPANRDGSDSPVVLAGSDSIESFNAGYDLGFALRFLVPFADENMMHGITLQPAVFAGDRTETPGILIGLDEIKAAIRKLGSRYKGTLLLTAFPKQADAGRWIETLNSFRKPVVFFDQTDTGEAISRKGMPFPKCYFRLHLDDRGAVRLALKKLYAAGHTRIGVHGGEMLDWSKKRAELIRQCAEECTPPLTILEAGPAEPFWNIYSKERWTIREKSIFELISKIKRTPDLSGPSPAEHARQLVEAAPSLAELIIKDRPTALIGMNDEMARDLYFWLQATGIEVPRHLSMISFDNTPTNFLVSSVDWGLSRLGYLAAHIFIGDIPIAAGREGNIPGPCTMVNRGSIAAPYNGAAAQLPGSRIL